MKLSSYKQESGSGVQSNDVIYATLCSLLCVLMVTSNLIFKKFVALNISNFINFEVSVGLLVFPLTFILTDIVAELYGRKKALIIVLIGFCIDILVIGLIALADSMLMVSWSTVDDITFHKVFGGYYVNFMASMIAFLIAQVVDISLFTRIRQLTKGKHLWLRGNVSTITAQLVDTFFVLSILSTFNILPKESFLYAFLSSFSYKVLFCILSTPFLYGALAFLRTKIHNHHTSNLN